MSSDVLALNGREVNGRKLRLFSDSTALRVNFSNKRARGVEFLKNGKRIIAHARKKVIIAAGINSAQLLMLSGIGSAKILKKAGIRCIFNNPKVGKSLRNHTLNFAVFQSNPSDRPLPSNDPNALYTGGAFLSDPLEIDRKRRAVQILGIGSKGDTLTLGLIYLRPKSRGSIRIQNKDPLKIVLADEGFLDNPNDLEAVKNIYKIYVKNIAAELMSIDLIYRLISPTPETIDNDAQLEQFIKENFEYNHHQQSSLRMAPLKIGGVVDQRGNVHGVKDLIVADASIIPFTVDGNTSAAAYLIGYTIAKQVILIDKRKQRREIREKFEDSEE